MRYMKLVLNATVVLLLLTACSRFSTRQGPPPILEPLSAPPPAEKPVLEEFAPRAEAAYTRPGEEGVVLPSGTAIPVRKN